MELLAFNPQKFTRSCDSSHASCSKILSRVMSGLSLGASLPNLKFVALAFTETLAFNTQILRGHVTLATPPFTLLTFGG